MTAREQVVRTVADAPWLPPGGRADVVRAEGGSCPDPASLVRLLVERDDAVFCVPRDGTGRPDLPTTQVAPGETGWGAARRLADDVLGTHRDLTVVGYVRNTVRAGPGYPWPTPHAHFVVFGTGTAGVRVPGDWVPLAAPGALVDRHWWPLVG
ncbi:NUDIX hydrolase [Cellulosimicrobium protaetiae]|uniref:NUDIX hydrolase n=1 Tax=Cellulosimicrobium protaetiae TaxID=2587808 RepID=A0A6M5UDF6_9MICO|nr:NUDIX hydrolase [Cellulosimicrobium protaetiae]QJW36240.1 NUDIX hydrolase [Cellulosimicrobium protaetiae]